MYSIFNNSKLVTLDLIDVSFNTDQVDELIFIKQHLVYLFWSLSMRDRWQIIFHLLM